MMNYMNMKKSKVLEKLHKGELVLKNVYGGK